MAFSILVGLLLGAPSLARRAAALSEVDPCEGAGTAIRINTADHALYLCSAGRMQGTYRVALGTGGVDKRTEGDHKTPRGRYPLAAPRPSKLFGTFILIRYPTVEQQRSGFTGSDVGIHGPPRAVPFGSAYFDWTAGCIAVDRDTDIEAIAEWVRRTKARWIEIS